MGWLPIPLNLTTAFAASPQLGADLLLLQVDHLLHQPQAHIRLHRHLPLAPSPTSRLSKPPSSITNKPLGHLKMDPRQPQAHIHLHCRLPLAPSPTSRHSKPPYQPLGHLKTDPPQS